MKITQIGVTDRAIFALTEEGRLWWMSLTGGAPIAGHGWQEAAPPSAPPVQPAWAPPAQPSAATQQPLALAPPPAQPQRDSDAAARLRALATQMEAANPGKAAEIRRNADLLDGGRTAP